MLKYKFAIACGLSAVLATVVAAWPAPKAPAMPKFPDAHEAPPRGWKGMVFHLRTDYPKVAPAPVNQPWRKLSFKTQPKAYMQAVLNYCLEGNLETDFVVQKNKKRNWYHVPWLHWGPFGREFINGFTVELPAPPGKLGVGQVRTASNISIGFYNDVAAATIGKVWNSTTPNYSKDMKFADGSVTFKTLHVDADAQELPYLKDSPEYLAYIPSEPGGISPEGEVIPPSANRVYKKVRLLQIDIGVRDTRANDGTGWVFGTFVYDGTRPGNNPWKKLIPVGLHWGNSPGVTPTNGKALSEQWINPDMKLFPGRQNPGMGYAGRMNGPLDNPASACLSCHGTAQMVNQAPLAPMPNASQATIMSYFNNVKPGKRFLKTGGPSTDYSLQLAMSVSNYLEWNKVVMSQRSPEALTAADMPNQDRYIETRQGSFLEPSNNKGGK
ncbi:hypothetical protein BH11ARM1_BH11ARM1_12350 [soil metagenome]